MYVSVFPEALQREVQPSYYKTTNYGSPQPESPLLGPHRQHNENSKKPSTLEKCCNLRFIAPVFKRHRGPHQKHVFCGQIFHWWTQKKKKFYEHKAFFIWQCHFLISCEIHHSLSHLSLLPSLRCAKAFFIHCQPSKPPTQMIQQKEWKFWEKKAASSLFK